MSRRVVITGVGMITPVGVGAENSFAALLEGKSGARKIDAFDPTGFPVQIAAQCWDYNPDTYYSPKDQRRYTRFIQFGMQTAKEAWAMSGLDIAKEDPYRVAVIYGSGIGSLGIIEEQHKILLEKGPTRISPFLVSGMIVNEVAGCIAIEIGAKGVNYAPVTACATGGHAIGEAFRAIKHGYADIAIGGGSESAITPLAVAGFAALRALSTRNDDPATASRPFTKTRDGFVIAEGAGAVILEEYEHAKARGANIIAEIVGYGATGDAYHLTAPDESGEAGARAVQLCLEEGKINPEDVTYVNAHGTSTPLNDKIETHVIKRAFGESAARKTMMSSTKSMTGHLLGGAGAIEAAIIALTVKNDAIPPTINYQDPDPECDLDYVPNAARKVPVKYAISNSLGFGGHNVCLALKKFS